jgi:hypothetical protein
MKNNLIKNIMKKIHILIVSVFVTVLILACSKGEQGDIGPVGNAGSKGLTGDKGEIGISNSKGMLVSSWFEAKPTDWLPLSNTAFNNKYYLIRNISALTKDVVSRGGVYVYVQLSNSTAVYPLPYSVFTPTEIHLSCVINNLGTTPGFQFNIDTVRLNGKVTDNYKFRVVIIPTAARISGNVDWSNYESVKKYLNLND